MNWMTAAWPMVVGACVTLALINLRIAMGDGRRAPHVFFFMSALAVAAISGMELVLLQTDDLGRYQAVLRWAAVPIAIMVASVAGFVRTFFGTGRVWLAVTGVGLLVAAEIASFTGEVQAVRNAVAVRQVATFGGAHCTVPIIVGGPWTLVEIAGVAVVMVFVFDASLTLWRRGGRRRAVIVGGSIIFFFLISRGHAILVEKGIVQTPYFVSFAFLAVLIAMGHELSHDVLHAARLSNDLQTSEQRLKLVAAAARLALWEWDIRKDSIWVSDEGRLLYGVAPQEEIDFKRFASTLHADDREGVKRALDAALAGPEPFAAEYRAVLPDGTVRWIAADGSVERDAQARATLLRGVSMDVTERKRAELEVAHHREELAHLSRVSILGELSGSIAHELNQPLAAILSNAQVGSRSLADAPPDLTEMTAIFDDIAADAKRAGGVIHGMRAMFKKNSPEASQAVDVHEAVADTLNLLHSEIVGRKVHVDLRLAELLPPVMAGRVEIQQVLINLILNSLDALKAGTVPARIEIATARQEGRVIVSVRDNGPGIPAEFMARLFEPFATNKPGGLGLGLAICRRITDRFGGELSAENHPGGGAVFRMVLNVADPQKPLAKDRKTGA
jgi:PAS domain S-box-containing protein